MATPPRVSITADGSIMKILKSERSHFLRECVNEVCANPKLYKKIMTRVKGGLTVEDFLPPGYIIVEAATLQPAPQEPIIAAPPKSTPAAKPAPEQKPAEQPHAGAEEGVETRPVPVEGRHVVIKHHFADEPKA